MTGHEWFKTLSADALAKALYNSGECCRFCANEKFNRRIDCVKTTTPEICVTYIAEFLNSRNPDSNKNELEVLKELPVEELAEWLISVYLECYFCPGCEVAPKNSCELGVILGLNTERNIDILADMVNIVDVINCD